MIKIIFKKVVLKLAQHSSGCNSVYNDIILINIIILLNIRYVEHANETNCVHFNFILVGYIFRVKFTTFNLEDYNKNEKKIYPVHKRTESRPEIVFYYFFKLQTLILYLHLS